MILEMILRDDFIEIIIIFSPPVFKYATEVAEKLKIKGWIMLNKRGVIRGQIEGEKDKVDEM